MDVVFLDANVLFSAAYRPRSSLRRLWDLTDVRLITSACAVEEARRNLPTPQQRAALETLLRTLEVAPEQGKMEHPILARIALPEKDRPILLAAIAAQATHLLAGDARHFGAYYEQEIAGVMILPPAAYLCIVAERMPQRE
ncbi:MAG: PIN domain-containing protein [Thermomicrobia bacterium]|nr:PIN domain-containing protein [Thermomicrobia bacterium]